MNIANSINTESLTGIVCPPQDPPHDDLQQAATHLQDQALPLLPLYGFVMLPYVSAPVVADDPDSIDAAEAALNTPEKMLIVATVKAGTPEISRLIDGDSQPVVQNGPSLEHEPDIVEERELDLYDVGVKVVIKQMRRRPDGISMILQGVERVQIESVIAEGDFLRANVSTFQSPKDLNAVNVEANRRVLLELATEMLILAGPNDSLGIQSSLASTTDNFHLVFLIASMLEMETAIAQELLETKTELAALNLMHTIIEREIEVLKLKGKIDERTQAQITDQQRETMLRQQMRAIQMELGEQSPGEADSILLREQLDQASLPAEVFQEVSRELRRLEQTDPSAPDYQIARSYIELVLELPWNQSTLDSIDLDDTLKTLNEDHFGLAEIKDRIIEHLAVMKLNPEGHAPILCFFGPPGTGKTSLGQSIARAIGRKFERMSLGGMHDESELRGHRRTYIGAMPGGVIKAIRRAKVNNPLIMLDEIDKLGRDYRGDPAGALLEILDPSQNATFRDNYLDIPFDLSKTLFIATANSLDSIPEPLFDRMEIIQLVGYTDAEKLQIAKRYLIPRQLKNSGVDKRLLKITNNALTKIISDYTREVGVRQLERAIGKVSRKVAVRVAKGDTNTVTIKVADLPELLGHRVHRPELIKRKLTPGTATGLAWTAAGGELLFIEGLLLPHGKGLQLTGQLGGVMQESARAAQSFVWSHAAELGIDPSVFQASGVHLHVPAGAIPKDGPSAGITMATVLVSLYTGHVVRSDTAMTGEITLGGDVLPIGGIKSKVLAAQAAGIKQIILPKANEDDLSDLTDDIRKEIRFFLVSHIKDVLKIAIPELKFKKIAKLKSL